MSQQREYNDPLLKHPTGCGKHSCKSDRQGAVQGLISGMRIYENNMKVDWVLIAGWLIDYLILTAYQFI